MTADQPDNFDLVYRAIEIAVFAPRVLAERMDQIHRALSHSKTWRQFKKNMPPDEYEEVMRQEFDEAGERRPNLSDAFNASSISGVGDGDYPRWLAPNMDEWIPLDLLEKYATREATTINGDYWDIPETEAAGLAKELRSRGYKVTEECELEFY